MALEVLHEKAKPPGPKAISAKTKIQSFGNLIDDTVQLFFHVVRKLKPRIDSHNKLVCA